MHVLFLFENVEAIIFDLDDTLVKSTLDFACLKAKIGCEKEDDILSFIDKIECQTQQALANQTVLEHELNDALTSTWLPGAEEFVYQAKTYGLPLAIVTRNCKQATQIKINNNNIPIDLVFTREDAPAKPDPTALIAIANKWQIAPSKIAYIGDYIYDIQAAHNGNMQAWLYRHKQKQYAQNLSYIAPDCT
jgi:HAD superfamily hydrolase (TIGR01549 family)